MANSYLTPTEIESVEVLDNRILLDVLDQDEVSTGGLIIHAHSRMTYKKAVVLKVGPGKWNKEKTLRIPNELTAFDVVMFEEKLAKEVKINSKKFFVIKETDIIGVIGRVSDGKVELDVQNLV